MPSLTIAIPAYNAEKKLTIALNSVRQASRGRFQVWVIDDGSTDRTAEIAEQLADKVIRHTGNQGAAQARLAALKLCETDLIAFLDDDIIIPEDYFDILLEEFATNPEADAITGILSADIPKLGFFAEYKHLYMHYSFKGQSKYVSYLSGGCCALKTELRNLIKDLPQHKLPGEDTALGQALHHAGKIIVFSSRLSVIHLKEYTLFTLLRNDFRIPYYWSKYFIEHQGLQQILKRKQGFAHASKRQLIKVSFMPIFFITLLLCFSRIVTLNILLILFVIWFLFNFRFHLFLYKKQGLRFYFKSIALTLIDQLVMSIGITCGLMINLIKK